MDSDAPKKKQWHEILASLTPLILGVAITGVGAAFTQVYNFRQLQLNQLNALEKFRPLLVSENSYDREFAYASFAALGYEQLAFKIIQMKQDTAGRAVVEEIRQSGSAAAKEEASAALSSIPARVFVHIASEVQLAKVKDIVLALQDRGFVVPGVENVSGKAELPKNTNVRYFNAEDKPAAEAIAELLREKGVAGAYASNVTRYKVKPGSLEVWFSAEAM
jgi:hypothetical protein